MTRVYGNDSPLSGTRFGQTNQLRRRPGGSTSSASSDVRAGWCEYNGSKFDVDALAIHSKAASSDVCSPLLGTGFIINLYGYAPYHSLLALQGWSRAVLAIDMRLKGHQMQSKNLHNCGQIAANVVAHMHSQQPQWQPPTEGELQQIATTCNRDRTNRDALDTCQVS